MQMGGGLLISPGKPFPAPAGGGGGGRGKKTKRERELPHRQQPPPLCSAAVVNRHRFVPDKEKSGRAVGATAPAELGGAEALVDLQQPEKS